MTNMTALHFGPRKFRALPTEEMNTSDEVFEIDADDAEAVAAYQPAGHWCESSDPEATLVTSQLSRDHFDWSEIPDKHWPVIDLDIPVHLVRSTNSEQHGGGHLYINHPVSFDGLIEILSVLEKHGIVQEGYLQAAKIRGFSAARLPHIKKPA